MDVLSVSSYYYYLSSPFLRLSDAMIPNTMLPLLCKPNKSLTHVKIDLVVSPNRSISSSLHLQSSQNVPSLICDSSTSTNGVLSFTIDDIITSCGLSDRFRVLCKSSEKPNAVLKLLSDYGFSQTQVETMVSKYPRILSCSVEKILKPKIDFLRSVGLSETEFLGVVTTCPRLFTRSLKNHLVPIVEFLITSFGSRDNAVLVIKRYPFILVNSSKRLVPNLSTLRNLGIPQSKISNMMANVIGGRVIACTKPCRFSKVVSTAMEMGFDPLSLAFKNAVSAMLFCPGSTWEEKLVFYKTLGFSDEETLDIFRFNPSFISRSEEVIRGPVEFYVKKFHWSPSQLSRRPVVLTFSLEKRIIPRCLVVQVLLSRNKIQENVKLSTVLTYKENEFLQRYVTRYKDETPEVLDAYQGKMKSAECDFYWEELSSLPFKIIL
ncbi:hypothetical protein RHGRI_004140 [Rhododendron griersonianum]|uniref:Mitochondrial transcription termination factor family protein n=1 Tax=Rhododendron griersonianum TaxID=479676 RepID=A0AAV6L8H7_9ERIC|nr:hypothetical protein RHGRI_004140 [Rhododendron griersonianum]